MIALLVPLPSVPQAIKNIIFDLGGVLLNIDYTLTEQAFMQLGMRHFAEVYSQAKQSLLFDSFETGKISASEFRKQLRPHLPENTSNADIDKAWNAMLLDFPAVHIEWLTKLKTKKRLFLLSNTNEIHEKAFETYLHQTFGENIFSQLFENYYYSHRIGLRKPDAACFRYVLEKNKLQASETLFIDDSLQHIEGAQACGIHARWLSKQEKLWDFINPYW